MRDNHNCIHHYGSSFQVVQLLRAILEVNINPSFGHHCQNQVKKYLPAEYIEMLFKRKKFTLQDILNSQKKKEKVISSVWLSLWEELFKSRTNHATADSLSKEISQNITTNTTLTSHFGFWFLYKIYHKYNNNLCYFYITNLLKSSSSWLVTFN